MTKKGKIMTKKGKIMTKKGKIIPTNKLKYGWLKDQIDYKTKLLNFISILIAIIGFLITISKETLVSNSTKITGEILNRIALLAIIVLAIILVLTLLSISEDNNKMEKIIKNEPVENIITENKWVIGTIISIIGIAIISFSGYILYILYG